MEPRRQHPWSSVLQHFWLIHSARTAIAATIASAVAALLRLPEAYWAPITTIIVMQSTLGASWTTSKQRLVGTVLGAVLAGLVSSFLEPQLFVFGAGVLALGLLCGLLHLDQRAYRFAGVTFAIIVLVTRVEPAWFIGLHRFIEVSLGIAVALALSALGPTSALTHRDTTPDS